MSQSKNIRRVVPASPIPAPGTKRRLRVLSLEEVGRPWPPGSENMLVAPRQNEQLRLDIVKKLLAGEGEECELPLYPKFSKRDLKRANLVVRTLAPHRAAEIEVLIRVKYPGPRSRPGHPRDPMTERAALAFELLKRCRARRPAQTIHAILKDMGKYITEESIERDYRRRNRARLVRVHPGLTQIPAGDLHRVLLWRLHSLFSLTRPRPQQP